MPFPVGYEGGRLDFPTLTLPNPAMAVIEFGFSQLWTFEVQHDNRETATATIPYPGVMKGMRASIPLLITGDCNKAGTPYANHVEGLLKNIEEVNLLAVALLSDDGTVDVTFTPYTGATPRTGRVQALPLQMSNSAKIGGTAVGLELILPDGPLTE